MTSAAAELVAAFIQLGETMRAYQEAERIEKAARDALQKAATANDAATAKMFELARRHDIDAPGNFGFGVRLSNVLSILASQTIPVGDGSKGDTVET